MNVPCSLTFAACAALLVTALIAGCGERATEEILEGETLYFEPIGYGQRGSLSDSIEIVFRERDVWLAYRDSLLPIAPFDSVDFDQAVVLLAALPQTSSGYGIEFTSVVARDTVVVAEYVVNVPSGDCLTAYADVVPFQAVLVRRTELPVRFERSEDEYRCTIGLPR